MSTIRNLKVTKRPRDDPLQDIPINFPPLQNLHLELLEMKEKLKPGLPLIPMSKPVMRPNATPAPIHNPSASRPSAPKPSAPVEPKATSPKPQESIRNDEKDSVSPEHPTPRPEKSKGRSEGKPDHIKSKDHEDDLIRELGEDSEEESDAVVDSDDEFHSDQSEVVEDLAEDEEEGDYPVEEEEEEDDIYAGLTPEEREIKEKEEYIWRFRILKKQYGKGASIPIPEWNEHSDLHMMKTSYERTIRELYLDDAVETYRTYLLGGWIVMEYVCTQLIGIDLRGFTMQQTKMMYKYDRLLIELGEKSYTRWGMNLPVEVRLIGMIIFQAGIFYLGKVISDKYGGSMAELFRGFTGQPPDPIKESPQASGNSGDDEVLDEEPKKRMRGPKIKAADIRKRTSERV